jgi:hypothetical protein
MERDASEVIEHEYPNRQVEMPWDILDYESGDNYKLSSSHRAQGVEFDLGGNFPQKENVPLVVYLSSRHGFKESKFSLTAAAETLNDEVSPQWTLITLSHEIMHNRVRLIFQALFGADWDKDRQSVITQQDYDDFKKWYDGKIVRIDLRRGLRNSILNFCLAMARGTDIKPRRRSPNELDVNPDDLNKIYSRFKLHATEIFVHFHDYYFTYACQPKIYTMSLWASWIKVAAPYTRPLDYVTRTLATIACGTGLCPANAFGHARDLLEDALSSLERSGVTSPLFQEVRRLLGDDQVHVYFAPYYYLMDQVSRFFASEKIAARIVRLQQDPFAEGSTSEEDYFPNIFVFPESDNSAALVSPIRYTLASLMASIKGQAQINDHQWLTAWNMMVISSQEVPRADA